MRPERDEMGHQEEREEEENKEEFGELLKFTAAGMILTSKFLLC
jgi:hypothetical protein